MIKIPCYHGIGCVSAVAHLSPWDHSPLISCLLFPEHRTAGVVMVIFAAVVAEWGGFQGLCAQKHVLRWALGWFVFQSYWFSYLCQRFRCASDLLRVNFAYMKTKGEMEYFLRCNFPSWLLYSPVHSSQKCKKSCIIEVAQPQPWLFLAFPFVRDTPSSSKILDQLINILSMLRNRLAWTGRCFWRLHSSIQISHLSPSTTEIIFIKVLA